MRVSLSTTHQIKRGTFYRTHDDAISRTYYYINNPLHSRHYDHLHGGVVVVVDVVLVDGQHVVLYHQ